MNKGSLSRSQLAAHAVDDLPRISAELDKTQNEHYSVRAVAASTWGTNETYVGWAMLLKKKDAALFEQVKQGRITIRRALDVCHAKHGKTRGPQVPAGQWNSADYNKAEFYLGRLTAIPDNLERINVDAIRSNVLLCQHWVDACKRARSSLGNIQKLLEEKKDG